MRGAFVVRLGAETKPKQGLFEGWVEEVDSGKELRFHSAGDLIQFLGERFRAAFQSSDIKGAQRCGSCEEES